MVKQVIFHRGQDWRVGSDDDGAIHRRRIRRPVLDLNRDLRRAVLFQQVGVKNAQLLVKREAFLDALRMQLQRFNEKA